MKKTVLPIFCARLKSARESSGKTIESLSELLGVSRMSVWNYENGRAEPRYAILSKIASILGVSADYLLGLSDSASGASVSQTGVNNAANVSGDVSQTAGQDCSSCPVVARLQGQVDLLREMIGARG